MTDIHALVESLIADGRGEEMLAKLKQANNSKEKWKFTPNPGPQTEAYYSKADVLLYGGSAGGGKSALIIGLAANEHNRSLIIRKQFADVHGLVDNAKAMFGTDEGFTMGPGGSRPTYKSPDGAHTIHFEGYGDVGGIGSKQGNPHDLIAIDEGAQLPLSAIKLLIGWNRPLAPYKGRCRVVIASNPPLDTSGDWMMDYFGAWLNPKHHNPAKPGELRWYNTDAEGMDIEASGPDNFIEIDGKKYYPRSRTFIPASVEDNPYLDVSYKSTLNMLDEPYRSALRDGNFLMARKDDPYQAIPTAWIKAAMERWKQSKRPDIPMCCMGVDIAQGGKDNTIIARRYGGWFDDLIVKKGKDTPDGSSVAGLILQYRRGNPDIVIDMGGGYGGSAKEHMEQNGIKVIGYKGASGSKARDKSGIMKFCNKRSEAYWKLREALDPSQDGGSQIMLPDDPELLSDLASPLLDMKFDGIKIEAKEDLKKRIGRSPDKGDAVVMAWSSGLKQENIRGGWKSLNHRQSAPSVSVGHANKRRTNYRGK